MSYQVLARKWRPRTFREMVGQEHVLQALINALDHDRLHHAYLFTGTRGVGKTTIARILAKCLNCEVGVSSVPCNECSSCIEINEGRFVDLIEVDAASRTKVEDTRELLENVQYAPTRGRYKVYLIDEVHMLSNSSFNALLKTLEEPPPHVKFLLATTDPQKLPVTILSRCLQFNLKNMNPEKIVSHLQFVLEKEMVPFEDAGLWQLARSADGSMRDALSLTDQSIAFGDGKITDVDVRTMLGTIDQSLVYDVLKGLIAEDIKQLLSAVANLSEHSPDYSAALAELIATLHRIAIAQALPEAVDNSQGDRQQIYEFAQAITAEDIQLYYQTALLGRRDLPLVPDPRSGFEMVLLRMLAFKPQGVNHLPKATLSANAAISDTAIATPVEADKAPVEIAPEAIVETVVENIAEATSEAVSETVSEAPTVAAVAENQVSDPVSQPMVESSQEVLSEPESETTVSVPTANTEDNHSASQTEHHDSAIPSEYEAFANMPNTEEDPSVKKSDAATEVAVDTEENAGAIKDEPYLSPALAAFDAPVIEDSISDNTEENHSERNRTEKIHTEKERVDESIETATESVVEAAVETSEETVEQTAANDSAATVKKRIPKIPFNELNASTWFTVYNGIDTGGLLQSTVANCALINWESLHLQFILDHQQSTLYDTKHQQYLADLLTEYFGHPIEATITLGDVPYETPSQIVIRQRQERQIQAEEAIANDPVVQQLQEMFDGKVVPESIKPID
ncbi:DNA polymerase III subunits gamma and tau [gamma proteobacterium IMCC1989]|nr:DNA polymerase III subunits gamma and tau [gamma proteobacterium IMCC1989]